MISIYGNGITALACQRMLSRRGHEARLTGEAKPDGPMLLLGKATLELLADVFDEPRFLQLGFEVPGRIVCGTGPATRVAAPACAVAAIEIVAQAACQFSDPARSSSEARFQIDASGRKAALARRLTGLMPTGFGTRHVVAAQFADSAVDAVLEVTRGGWLFLFPVSQREVVVQAMLASPPAAPAYALAAAIAGTRWICRIVEGDPQDPVAFPAAPAIFPVTASDRWLAVGAAAFAADPLCGDGTGMALRSALLATALVSQLGENGAGARIDHYQKRHQCAFAAHLRVVADFYRPLAKNPAWEGEMSATHAFLESPAVDAIRDYTGLRFRLNGGLLTPNNAE